MSEVKWGPSDIDSNVWLFVLDNLPPDVREWVHWMYCPGAQARVSVKDKTRKRDPPEVREEAQKAFRALAHAHASGILELAILLAKERRKHSPKTARYDENQERAAE